MPSLLLVIDDAAAFGGRNWINHLLAASNRFAACIQFSAAAEGGCIVHHEKERRLVTRHSRQA